VPILYRRPLRKLMTVLPTRADSIRRVQRVSAVDPRSHGGGWLRTDPWKRWTWGSAGCGKAPRFLELDMLREDWGVDGGRKRSVDIRAS
jgi:hypothetical protein